MKDKTRSRVLPWQSKLARQAFLVVGALGGLFCAAIAPAAGGSALAMPSPAAMNTASLAPAPSATGATAQSLAANVPSAAAVHMIAPNLPAFIAKPKPEVVKPEAPSATPAATSETSDVVFLEEARRWSQLASQEDATTSVWRVKLAPPRRRVSPKPAAEGLAELAALEEPPAEAKPQTLPEAEKKDEPVDINLADIAALLTVNGMDERRARSIVSFRRMHRPFATVDELSEVFGITDSMVDTWRTRLYASPARDASRVSCIVIPKTNARLW